MRAALLTLIPLVEHPGRIVEISAILGELSGATGAFGLSRISHIKGVRRPRKELFVDILKNDNVLLIIYLHLLPGLPIAVQASKPQL
jgi:hypothetical protein